MRTQVLLLFGGESSEHDVSIAGAANVFAALDDERYEIRLCYIDRGGRWWLVPDVSSHHADCPQLVPVLGAGRFITLPEDITIRPDVLLPILHGKNGEDGTVQGLGKLLHIPTVGPSLLGAALTMDKDLTKRVLREGGVPVIDDIVWNVADELPKYSEVKDRFGGVVFVKPARAGSSVGVTKVHDESEFRSALRLAAAHDSKVLIEPAISGQEVELSVLGNEHPSVSMPGEIRPGAEFYDYADKYDAASKAQVIVPAELDEATTAALRRHAARAYRLTSGHGMARVDFFVADDGNIYLLEVNAIPGFTSISMYPKLWRERGMTYPALLDKLISLALEK